MINQALANITNDPNEILVYVWCMSIIIGLFLITMGLSKMGFVESLFSLPILSGYLGAAGVTIVVD